MTAWSEASSYREEVADYARLLVEKTPIDASHDYSCDFPSYQKVRQYESVVQLLLSRGAEADTSAGHFGTTLSLAAYMGLHNTFDSLLQHGVRLDASGGFLQSPLPAAILGGHSKMAKDLLSLGPWGRSEALCSACRKGNLHLVKALLDSGVHSAATDADGQTALQLALAKVASPGRRFSSRS
jgi:ankyrin repeat protein